MEPDDPVKWLPRPGIASRENFDRATALHTAGSVACKVGSRPDEIRIFLRHTKGSSFSILIERSASIRDVKEKIFAITDELPPELRGIPPEHAVVCRDAHAFDEELLDEHTLEEYDIRDEATLGICFRVQILDIFSVDTSASMYRSRNNNFVMSIVSGKSRLEEAKDLIQEWISKYPEEADEQPPKEGGGGEEEEEEEEEGEEEDREWDHEERYSSLVLFSKKTRVEVNDKGNVYDRATATQMKFILKKVQGAKTKSWIEPTGVFAAIRHCEKIIDKFRREKKNRGVVRVMLHLFTDGVDTTGEKKQEGYLFNKDLERTTFLYSFASSFSASHALATKIGANLVFVKSVEDALRQQDNLIYTFKLKPPSKGTRLERGGKKKKKEAALKSQKKKKHHKQSPGKFNLLIGENPEVQTIKKFLKLALPMLQDPKVLRTKGIFRLSETAQAVDNVIDQTTAGVPRLGDIDPKHPHRTAHALKNFLRAADPLIHVSLQPSFLRCCCEGEPLETASLRKLASQVPPANRECLQMVFCLLSSVARNAQYNLMDAASLGIIFAPVLFPELELSQVASATKLVTHLIQLGPSFWEAAEHCVLSPRGTKTPDEGHS